MKYLLWLLKAAIFFALFAFALNNQAPVHLHLFFGTYWQAPLVLVLLCVLAMGVVLGVLVMLPMWLRARRALRVAQSHTGNAFNPQNANTAIPPPPGPHGH